LWFPLAVPELWLGVLLIWVIREKPTGTSSKFANMTEQALHEFEDEHGVKFDKITKIPFGGDGTIAWRVERCVSLLPLYMIIRLLRPILELNPL